MKALESPLLLSSSAEIQGLQDFGNDENEVKKSSDLLPPLVKISLCESSGPAGEKKGIFKRENFFALMISDVSFNIREFHQSQPKAGDDLQSVKSICRT